MKLARPKTTKTEVEEPVAKKTKKATRTKSRGIKEDSRASSVSGLIDKISKSHGPGSLMKMGEAGAFDVGTIPSGSIGLDYALGIGGYPRGRIVEVYGPEASGKTTLTLHAIAECQKSGGIAAFIDAEHAMDLAYAGQLGVDTTELLFSQPDFGEQALQIVDEIVRADIVDIVVIDSVSALVPKAEIDGEMGKSHVGLQARMMSQALRKLTGVVAKTNTCLIFINQIREKIGVMWGSPETTTGGRALKFYSSCRIDVRRIKGLTKGDESIGNRVRAKIVKNKLAAPHKTCEFDIVFGHGIDSYGDLLDISVDYGLMERSGAWYSYEGNNVGQGRDKTIEYLKQNPEILTKLNNTIRNDLFGGKNGEGSKG